MRETSEINQLIGLGLITKDQYYGVDWDGRKIKGNKKRHPQAHWLAGDWEEVLLEYPELFNPEIVFLDFTSLASTEKILSATQQTLRSCPMETYVFVNTMLNIPHPHKSQPGVPRFKETWTFPDELAKYITDSDFQGWAYLSCKDLMNIGIQDEDPKDSIACYRYTCTGSTFMCMYALWKGRK
jgi:hypothetical protein